jgi:hypothetical protein
MKNASNKTSLAGYADAAALYVEAGWRGVLPIPAGRKWPPPAGFTGKSGLDPEPSQIQEWRRERSDDNIALRLPQDVVGFDVDHHGTKRGGDVLALLEERFGALPPTWVSSSRDDETSGIRLYGIPKDLILPGQLGPGIDILRHEHRYCMVSPSWHPDGPQYVWWDPCGYLGDRVPRVDEVPQLPKTWVDWIASLVALPGEVGSGAPKSSAGMHPYPPVPAPGTRGWTDGLAAARVKIIVRRAKAAMSSGASRHNATCAAAASLARYIVAGYEVALAAAEDLADAFVEAISAGPNARSTRPQAEREWTT